MQNGTCFVISQIGEEDSVERLQADALFRVLENCCELHNLECIRADRLAGATDITVDTIENIRRADLCIVDLTNLNPNVMYEFGIRFQTGLPYIVLASKQTTLPFDTNSIRTIFYENLDSAREARAIQDTIREFIRAFEREDFRAQAKVPSLSNIYALLEQVDSKLSEMSVPHTLSSPLNSTILDSTDLDDLLSDLDPVEAFHYAYKTNQIPLAEKLLGLLKDSHPSNYYFNKLCALCVRGSANAAKELESSIDRIMESNNSETIIEAIGALVSNYNYRDVEEQRIDDMNDVFVSALSKMETNKEKAAILNQQQRLLAGAGRYAEAKEIIEKTIALNDEEAAYFFNYATLLDHLGDVEAAIMQIKRCIALRDDDDDHLYFACRLLKKSKRKEDATMYKHCLSKLEKINSYKARLVRFQ